MKFLQFIFFLFIIFLFNYSNEQLIDDQEITTADMETTENITIVPPRPGKRTTTSPNRVSEVVLITVPVVIFALTFLIGFGLIAYATITGGNGIFFLTRTNERLLP